MKKWLDIVAPQRAALLGGLRLAGHTLLRAAAVQSAVAAWLLAALSALHPDAPKLFASLCSNLLLQLPQ